jgi:hypothetical protein
MTPKAKRLLNDADRQQYETSIQRLSQQVCAARADYKRSMQQSCVLQAKYDAAVQLSRHRATVGLGGTKGRQLRGVSVVVPLTDWHCGEVIRYHSMEGVNEYNVSIWDRRVNRLYSVLVSRIESRRRDCRITELWLPLLGDFIAGDIHADLRESNEATATEAVGVVLDRLASFILQLRKDTKLPIYVPTVVGNHGRSTEKIRFKTSHENSWEQLLYHMLARALATTKGVEVRVGDGLFNTQIIAGRRTRFLHGHIMRYNGGVGGLTVPVNNAVRAWNGNRDCDFTIFGHFHQRVWCYPRWVCCGCLVGYSEFSAAIRSEFQHPTQEFMMISPEYGMIESSPLFVTDAKRKRETVQ